MPRSTRSYPQACAKDFLANLLQAAHFKITKILTGNGQEFTDRFCATRERQPTCKHSFDRVCAEHHLEQGLIPPRHPQTNGMIEDFHGRISEVLATRRTLGRAPRGYPAALCQHLQSPPLAAGTGSCVPPWRPWNIRG